MDSDQPDGAERIAALLADLPASAWRPLARAARRAFDRRHRNELPTAVRPFAGWRADRLTAERPRRAVAAALAEDPVLREAIGQALVDHAWDAAEDATPHNLERRFGADVALAALVCRARWDDAISLGTRISEQAAALGRAAAEAPGPHAGEPQGRSDDSRQHAQALATARHERDEQRRRRDAAETRARQMADERDRLLREVAALRGQLDEAVQERIAEAAKHRDRLARLRRRADEAETRADAAAARVESLAAELDGVIGRLRGHVPEQVALGEPEREVDTGGPVRATTLPRGEPVATGGRPCTLPAGLASDSPHGVRSLLRVPRLQVLVDGYNVTMDAKGRPAGSLEEQRRWLVRVSAAVRARFGRPVTVVFDGGSPRPGEGAAARGVHVLFTAPDELADDRIVELVAAMDHQVPVLVVSTDRELQGRCEQLGANSAPSGAFLAAVNA